MIRIRDHKQRHLFDPWGFLSPRRRWRLDEGWPGLFREHLLGELPVEQMRPFFREDFGRPTKELHTVPGVLHFQQAMDLNDTEAIEQLADNIQWHYALDIVEESDEAETLLRVSADLFDLVEAFTDQLAVREMYTYRMMQRFLADQCHIQTDGGKAVTLRRPAVIASDSCRALPTRTPPLTPTRARAIRSRSRRPSPPGRMRRKRTRASISSPTFRSRAPASTTRTP